MKLQMSCESVNSNLFPHDLYTMNNPIFPTRSNHNNPPAVHEFLHDKLGLLLSKLYLDDPIYWRYEWETKFFSDLQFTAIKNWSFLKAWKKYRLTVSGGAMLLTHGNLDIHIDEVDEYWSLLNSRGAAMEWFNMGLTYPRWFTFYDCSPENIDFSDINRSYLGTDDQGVTIMENRKALNPNDPAVISNLLCDMNIVMECVTGGNLRKADIYNTLIAQPYYHYS